MWQWGQFIDHDFGLTPTNSAEPSTVVIALVAALDGGVLVRRRFSAR